MNEVSKSWSTTVNNTTCEVVFNLLNKQIIHKPTNLNNPPVCASIKIYNVYGNKSLLST